MAGHSVIGKKLKNEGRVQVNIQSALTFPKTASVGPPESVTGNKKRGAPEPVPNYKTIGRICDSSKLPAEIYRVEKGQSST